MKKEDVDGLLADIFDLRHGKLPLETKFDLLANIVEKFLIDVSIDLEGKERYEEVSPQQTNRINSSKVRFEKMSGIKAPGADSQEESKRQSDCPG